MLVADGGRVSRAWMSALRRRGEIPAPKRSDELAAEARRIVSAAARVERSGAMAYVRA